MPYGALTEVLKWMWIWVDLVKLANSTVDEKYREDRLGCIK